MEDYKEIMESSYEVMKMCQLDESSNNAYDTIFDTQERIRLLKEIDVQSEHKRCCQVQLRRKNIIKENRNVLEKERAEKLLEKITKLEENVNVVISNKSEILCQLKMQDSEDGVRVDIFQLDNFKYILEKVSSPEWVSEIDQGIQRKIDLYALQSLYNDVQHATSSLRIGDTCLTRIEKILETHKKITPKSTPAPNQEYMPFMLSKFM